MVKVTVNYDKCGGAECGECADVCPMEVIIIGVDKIVIQNNAVYVSMHGRMSKRSSRIEE